MPEQGLIQWFPTCGRQRIIGWSAAAFIYWMKTTKGLWHCDVTYMLVVRNSYVVGKVVLGCKTFGNYWSNRPKHAAFLSLIILLALMVKRYSIDLSKTVGWSLSKYTFLSCEYTSQLLKVLRTFEVTVFLQQVNLPAHRRPLTSAFPSFHRFPALSWLDSTVAIAVTFLLLVKQPNVAFSWFQVKIITSWPRVVSNCWAFVPWTGITRLTPPPTKTRRDLKKNRMDPHTHIMWIYKLQLFGEVKESYRNEHKY